MSHVSISVHAETRDQLKELKSFDSMSYDDVIRILIDEADTEDTVLTESSDA